MTDRHRVLSEVIARARAAGKRIYGVSKDRPSCEELVARKQVPADWDYVCAEGDEEWTRLPKG